MRSAPTGVMATMLLAMGMVWAGAGPAADQVPASAPGQAAEATTADLAARRRAIDAQHGADLQACQSRFAVTACIDDVGRRRREALAPLREVELQLDRAERQRRAFERRQAIAAKERDAAALPPAAAALPLDPRWPAPEAAGTEPTRRSPLNTAPAEVRLRDTQAARRQQESQSRRERSLAAQARVAQRLRERADQGRAALPAGDRGAVKKQAPAASRAPAASPGSASLAAPAPLASGAARPASAAAAGR